MTVKNRLLRLEAKKPQAEKPMQLKYTQAQWEKCIRLFEQTFGVKLEAMLKAVEL